MNNKTKFFAGLALSILALSAHAEKIALVDGALIDPSRNEVRQPSTNTLIIIDGDRIERVGPKILETGTRVIDCKGKFILPGYSARTSISSNRPTSSRARTLSIS